MFHTSNKISKHSQSTAEQEFIVITAQTATLNLCMHIPPSSSVYGGLWFGISSYQKCSRLYCEDLNSSKSVRLGKIVILTHGAADSDVCCRLSHTRSRRQNFRNKSCFQVSEYE